MSSSEGLLDTLRSEGTLVGEGEFELDRAAAREKMQKFRLPSPHHCLLRFVEAASLLGADRVDFSIAADEIVVELSGVGLSVEQIDELYDAALSSSSDPEQAGLRQLAIGLAGALGFDIDEVRLESVTKERMITLTLSEDWENVRIRPHRSPRELTRVVIDKKSRFFHLFQGFSNDPGEELLRDFAAYSSCNVFVNDESINQGLHLPEETKGAFQFETRFERGIFALAPDGHGLVVDIVQNGVKILEHRRRALGVCARGVVESERLVRDLSQSAFVEDASWEKLTDEVFQAAIAGAMLEFLQHEDDYSDYFWGLQVECCRRTLQAKDDDGAESLLEASADIADLLPEIPVWPSAYRNWPSHTLQEILESIDDGEGREVYFSPHLTLAEAASDARILLHFPSRVPPFFAECVGAEIIQLQKEL